MFVRSETLTAMYLRSQVFWDTAMCHWVSGSQNEVDNLCVPHPKPAISPSHNIYRVEFCLRADNNSVVEQPLMLPTLSHSVRQYIVLSLYHILSFPFIVSIYYHLPTTPITMLTHPGWWQALHHRVNNAPFQGYRCISRSVPHLSIWLTMIPATKLNGNTKSIQNIPYKMQPNSATIYFINISSKRPRMW